LELKLQRSEAFLGGAGGGFGFGAALAGRDEAGVNRPHFTARGGRFRAQTLGARSLCAPLAVSLRRRAVGLGVSRPQENRKRPSRARDEGAGASRASCHAPSPITRKLQSR
jgi:hypothetical protein